ncbi:MAG: flippase-like domain-containing protein [Bacteroidales bacterium]|nr:flippase-like domain-containing protein [Bacteroidales bacterium]
MKKILKYVLLFALAAVLVYFAFRKVEWRAFVDGLAQTRWFWVVVFCIISATALLLRTVRWKEMLIPFDPEIKTIRVWDAINVGNLASVALPSSGEFLRCGYVTSKKLEYDKSIGTMFCERLWDLFALIVMAIISLFTGWDRFGSYFMDNIINPLSANRIFWVVLISSIIILAVAIYAIFRFRDRYVICRKIAESLSRIWAGLTVFRKSRNKLLIALTTVLIWTLYVLMCFCVIKAMPALDGLDMIDALFFSMVGNVASIVPVPGSVGAYHYLVASAVGVYGYNWDTGILYATLNHEIHAVIVIVIGLVAYLHWMRDMGTQSNSVNNP